MLTTVSSASLQDDEAPSDASQRVLEEIQRRAEDIVTANQQLELTTTEARGKVRLLLEELEAWADDYHLTLDRQMRTFESPARDQNEYLTVDRCPLFFEKSLRTLCPLDDEQSEVWGGRVVYCRYKCAPSADDTSSPFP